ncbi:Non-structural protein 3b [Labeo rohita]|uniref:Non-structural protein 3b n=1 Tax=Labeo rohita TaxID=84645 RepID=A0ABQ8M5Y0_LABRO|nr:Non-structural protein 3b [Labeo rohita]
MKWMLWAFWASSGSFYLVLYCEMVLFVVKGQKSLMMYEPHSYVHLLRYGFVAESKDLPLAIKGIACPFFCICICVTLFGYIILYMFYLFRCFLLQNKQRRYYIHLFLFLWNLTHYRTFIIRNVTFIIADAFIGSNL